ncbi:glucose-1-phosphate adenylyltransferase subunit GlgD [bacterium]|uniref:glucose-1-phosphate adenylyltransferase subunit GlgD n=1 Tax=Gemmiger sp. TaxID=2049027 RepID=UPI002A90B37C|nr:glucose-1-phosphate adenylyltransferase subunit GlgD [Gemmiger sp.]MCI7191841.1 glucose-1-phosphate adenylyltransferase subunit GlgD [bacterium]MCI7744538.1 glucose-1-phosphate adenylyltransferase subunit GlgD [bacterium]MDD6717628.1 glucose-1-phosphate adenylyltransferase subunit GlgD [bacterium]MDY5326789.1 glucose-1-phosphate adenylyltransferase subunit GlgD [Gemmiger sp.]
MVSSNANALGVIFANSYDNLVPELVAERTMGSIPFAGRYRMIDFVLSNMANAGIDNVSVIVRKNYHSLMDHLGSGREWDLTRKRGGLNIVPPFAERSVKLYSGRVDALASVLSWLQAQKERYVILSDTNVAMNFDFNKLIDAHVASGADVTMVYNRSEIPDGARNDNYTIRIDNGRVTELLSNDYRPGVQNLSLNLYIIERETLIQLIRDAAVRGLVYFERDILARNLNLLNVQAYEFDGYAARIADMKSYFDENMRLLEPGNVDKLFDPANPIYTKIRDDNPTRYLEGSKVKNSLLADGCVIEGTVENSVLFRGCQIKKGAVVKNCVLMQDTVVEEGCTVEYVVSDKNVHITSGKQLTGTDSFPVFVAKGHTV